MTRRRRRLRAILATLRRAAGDVYRFLGPAVGSLKGKVAVGDFVVMFVRAITVGGSVAGSVVALVHDPSFNQVVVIPVITGLLEYTLEYCSRKQMGPDDGGIPGPGNAVGTDASGLGADRGTDEVH